MNQLTPNAVRQIYDGVGEDPTLSNPVVQVINIKKLPMQSADSTERFRFIISDGKHFMQAMLSTQLNDLVQSGRLTKNAVIRMTKYICNAIQNRCIAIVLGAEVLAVTDRIGEPVTIEPSVVGAAPAASAAAPVAQPAPQPRTSIPTPAIPPNHVGLGQVAGPNDPADLQPISSLNPYQNRWTIRARVLSKSDIRTWKNARGEGQLFNVTLLDESGEIRGTAFRDQVDRLYPLLEENKVYYISRARVNVAKSQYSTVQNGYELTFEAGTECANASAVPAIRFNFVKIGDLMSVEKDQIIDVIGVAKETQELTQIITKTQQRPLNKREIALVDDSNHVVRLTLWGAQAESFNGAGEPIIACKGARVGDFQGRSLSVLSSSILSLNPDVPETHRLRGWYDTGGRNASFNGFSGGAGGMTSGGNRRQEIKTFEQVKNENLGMGEKPDYFTVKGAVMAMRDSSMYYPACPGENCNKKVTEESDGSWYCEKCQRNFGSPEYRYILSICVSDISGQEWLQCFNDIGTQLIGKTATELHALTMADDSATKAAVKGPQFKSYLFRCRAKQETYNEVQRVRYSIIEAAPVEPVAYSKQLLEQIQRYA
ncbi:replication factor-a protein [Thamnocephalis sphaerospora]|uniref:Replication protein A subunit n=1 Tax=Thamnocephalis sphaerospora TaxID=78915 RepID=A0A4P9XSL6_9FUNG|nr:replication factor-a protein [Thamnocephalis sphaerospora]|eukprot:RKP08491.1 replication factor-a protein [Thamnocephalis sphaerospora]